MNSGKYKFKHVKKEKSHEEKDPTSREIKKENSPVSQELRLPDLYIRKDENTVKETKNRGETGENSGIYSDWLKNIEDSRCKPKYSVPKLDDIDIFTGSDFDDVITLSDSEDIPVFRKTDSVKPCGSELPKPATKTSPTRTEPLEPETTNVDRTSSTVLNNSQLSFLRHSEPSTASKYFKQRGISFDDTDSENNSSENSQDQYENSEEKYKRIMEDSKRKLNASGWIDAKKMKKKVQKSSLFKR